ncbi:unnamed protein product [Amoebophrya sp. A25]|nr:unnamed protein product [Amoebophrya sp. A25]|eukprot:GSA25T00006124001.1
MGAGSSAAAEPPPVPHGSIVITQRLLDKNPKTIFFSAADGQIESDEGNYLEEGFPATFLQGQSSSAAADSPEEQRHQATGLSSSSGSKAAGALQVALTNGASTVIIPDTLPEEMQLELVQTKNELVSRMNELERDRIREKTEKLREVLKLDTLRKPRPHPCPQEEKLVINCLDMAQDVLRCGDYIDAYQLCAAKVA